MKKDCDLFQEKCLRCQEDHESQDVGFISIQGDWRRPYIEFIIDETLPVDVKEALKVKKKAAKFFMEKGELFKRSFKGQSMCCVLEEDKQTLMEEVHQGACGEHQGVGSCIKNCSGRAATSQPWKLMPLCS